MLEVDDSGMTLVCPLCRASDSESIPQFNSYAMERCRRCSFVYTKLRRILSEQYEDIYSGESAYRMMVNAAERTAAGEWGCQNLWWFKRKALRWIEADRACGRLVDVGSGPGTFLMVARQRGWEVQGVEPSALASEKAHQLGIDTFRGVVEDFALRRREFFDVATSFEVMEHVPDVVEMLNAIHSILKPGGIFVFSVPNLDDPFCIRQTIPVNMPPVHINFFRRRSLSLALGRAGFRIVRFSTLPIPTSSVRNIHGTLGFALRVPLLLYFSLVGRADGTTLLGMARRGG